MLHVLAGVLALAWGQTPEKVFAALLVPGARWTYLEADAREPEAKARVHVWVAGEVQRKGAYTSVLLSPPGADDLLPTLRVVVGPEGLSAPIDPQGGERPQTPAQFARLWQSPSSGFYFPLALKPGWTHRYELPDPQAHGTMHGTLRPREVDYTYFRVRSFEVGWVGEVCFLDGDDCWVTYYRLGYAPAVGFTRLCLGETNSRGRPANCLELSPPSAAEHLGVKVPSEPSEAEVRDALRIVRGLIVPCVGGRQGVRFSFRVAPDGALTAVDLADAWATDEQRQCLRKTNPDRSVSWYAGPPKAYRGYRVSLGMIVNEDAGSYDFGGGIDGGISGRATRAHTCRTFPCEVTLEGTSQKVTLRSDDDNLVIRGGRLLVVTAPPEAP